MKEICAKNDKKPAPIVYLVKIHFTGWLGDIINISGRLRAKNKKEAKNIIFSLYGDVAIDEMWME